MAALGSRFNSLLINASDPLDKGRKKQKKSKQENGGQKSAPKVATSQKATTTGEEVSANPVLPKSKLIVVKDIKHKSVPEPASHEVNKAPPVQQDPLVDDVEPPFEKDNRAAESRHGYRKMMVSSGRVYDRRGGPKTSARPSEKRSGHGAFNWGEAVESEIVGDKDDQAEKGVSKAEPSTPKKELRRVEYTLEQYKEMLRDKKIDPASYANPEEVYETVDPTPEDPRQYLYNNKSFNDRGDEQDSGRPSRGRGQGRGRGNRGYGQRGSNRGRRSYQGPKQNTEIRVDDMRDFPEL